MESTSYKHINHAIKSPPLPAPSFAFCYRYVKYYSLGLLLMIILEAGQAARSILLPFAIKQIMDVVAITHSLNSEVWGMDR